MKYIKTIIFLVLTLSIAACSGATATPEATQIPTVVADSAIVTEGRLEPIHYAELALNASGLVSEVLVSAGDQVAAGDVIARLESSQAQSLENAQIKAAQDLTSAYQEVRDTQYKFDNFDIPRDFKNMTPTEALKVTLEKLNAARADFEPYKNINDRNLQLTQAEKNGQVYQNTAKIYKKKLDDAWSDYRRAIQWMELESNLNAAQTRLAQAQKDYDALNDPKFAADTAGIRAALANAEVRAPFGGVVTDLNIKVGEFAASGQKVVTIADTSHWVVKTTDLTEIDVVNIKEGQSAVVKLDALPNVELNGNVLSVAQNYSKLQGDVVYEVTVLLTEIDPSMRWGMTAEVTFSK
ncbi:MAG: efflux RND transporter periplasmic adaptor subunit [Anaerolineales bacterium]|nr:efflux RND transporter periplasmic adaptor subunit [Anaerolineales bacterium]